MGDLGAITVVSLQNPPINGNRFALCNPFLRIGVLSEYSG
jgi:hypothetical protein